MLNTGIVDHADKRLTSLGEIYFLGEEFSDMKFFVGGRTFPAHRVVMASSSEAFK